MNRAAWVMGIFFVFPATMPAQDVRPTYPGYLFLARKGFEVIADAALREVFISAHPLRNIPMKDDEIIGPEQDCIGPTSHQAEKSLTLQFSRAQAIRRWTQR